MNEEPDPLSCLGYLPMVLLVFAAMWLFDHSAISGL